MYRNNSIKFILIISLILYGCGSKIKDIKYGKCVLECKKSMFQNMKTVGFENKQLKTLKINELCLKLCKHK